MQHCHSICSSQPGQAPSEATVPLYNQLLTIEDLMIGEFIVKISFKRDFHNERSKNDEKILTVQLGEAQTPGLLEEAVSSRITL